MANKASFPYERYETLAEPLTVYYQEAEEGFPVGAFQSITKQANLLTV